MKSFRRFLFGGLGALAPVLMFLATADLEHFFDHIEPLKLAGYLVRVAALFVIGGFVAYLHKTESNPAKLIQLGIAGPALLAGYLHSAQAEPVKSTSFSLFSTAYADTTPTRVAELKAKALQMPTQSDGAKFWEGLTGKRQDNTWLVVVSSHARAQDAAAATQQLAKKFPEFKTEVYAPDGNNSLYLVTVGAYLTLPEAKALEDKAIKAGLPKDTHSTKLTRYLQR